MITRDKVVSRLKATKISKGSRKFGIQVPNTIIEAEKMNLTNKHNYWKEAIEYELNDISQIPTVSKKIKYHSIFNVKMDPNREAHLIAGGYPNKYTQIILFI